MVITTTACKFLPSPWKQVFQYYGGLLNETTLYPDSYRETDQNEAPRHFIDLEIWDPNRPETGTLPQAVEEFTTKMEQSIQARDWNVMFLHAGRIAHYVADLAQPYHTTVNYDPLTRNGTALHEVFFTAFTSLITSLIVLKCATCGNPPMFKNSQGSFVCETCHASVCPRCGSQLRYDQACRESVCDKCKKKESELFTRVTTELAAEQTARPTIETKQIVYCYYCGVPLPTDAVFCRKMWEISNRVRYAECLKP